MDMDMWKYFGITHTDHTLMNPLSLAKTEERIDRLCLPDSGRVLDLACGKAEFLCLVAERYDVAGTGSLYTRIVAVGVYGCSPCGARRSSLPIR